MNELPAGFSVSTPSVSAPPRIAAPTIRPASPPPSPARPYIGQPERSPRRDRRIIPQPRWQIPDLTGFYEAASAAGRYAPLLVQLNQAGRTLVGWAVPPPYNVPMRSPVCFGSAGAVLSTDKWERKEVGLVFVADLGALDPVDSSVELVAAAVPLDTTFGIKDLWFLADDPTAVFGLLGNDPRTEQRIVRGKLRTSIRALTNHTQVTVLMTFNNSANGWEPLRQLNAVPRIPGAQGAMTFKGSFSAEPFRAWVTTHSRPVPSGYLEDKAKELAVDAKPGADLTTGELGQAIQDWHASDPKLAMLRSEKRDKVFKPLRTWLSQKIPAPDSAYGVGARGALLRALTDNGCKVKDSDGVVHRKSYRDWLTSVYGEEVDWWRTNGQPGGNLNITPLAGLGFDVGDFIYTFSFSTPSDIAIPKSVMERLPEWVTKGLGMLKKYTRFTGKGVTIGGTLFYAHVKLEEVKLKLDADGKPVIKPDGTYDAARLGKQPLWTTAGTGELSGLIGLFIDGGAGFPVPGVHFSSLEMLSAIGSLKKESFGGAWFEVGQMSTPSLPALGLKGLVSSRFSITKDTPNERFALTRIFDVPASGPTSPSDLQKILKPWQIELSGGAAVGFFVSGGHGARYPPPDPVVRKPTSPTEVPVTLLGDDFFDVGKHEISADPNFIGRFSRRNVLEASLAEYSCVILNPTTTRGSYGYASPEYDARFNLELSQDRAGALAQAYLDAFEPGHVVPFATRDVVGYGEGPSLESSAVAGQVQLIDPETAIRLSSSDPGYGAAMKKWRAGHADQVALWPQWRRAELLIDGRVIVSVGSPEQT